MELGGRATPLKSSTGRQHCVERLSSQHSTPLRRRPTMTESLDMESPMCVDIMSEAALAVSVRQRSQSPLENPPLQFVLRETQGSFVRDSCFRCSFRPPAEIRPGRVRQMIVHYIIPHEDGVNEHKSRLGAIALGHRRANGLRLLPGRCQGRT